MTDLKQIYFREQYLFAHPENSEFLLFLRPEVNIYSEQKQAYWWRFFVFKK